MRDHALREQAGEGFAGGQVEQAAIAQGAGEEAGIEQVENRVLDAANVLIDGQPVGGLFLVDRNLGFRIAEAREVPGRVDERIHRVGFAFRLAAAFGAGGVLPRRVANERVAGRGEVRVVGQQDGQLIVRHGYGATRGALDDRNRAAPIALARHAPVAQAVLRGGFTGALRDQLLDRCGDGFLGGETIQEVGVVDDAVAGIGLATDRVGGRIFAGRQHDGLEGQAVFLGELDVALVAGGRAEDRAGAIGRKDKVCSPDGQFPAGIEGVFHGDAEIDADFLGFLDVGFGRALGGSVGHELGDVGAQLRDLLRERMIGREREEAGAEQRVGARGEDFDGIACVVAAVFVLVA